MAKSSAQAQAEKPEAQKGGATKMPIFATKFDGSGSDNTDEFKRSSIWRCRLACSKLEDMHPCSLVQKQSINDAD